MRVNSDISSLTIIPSGDRVDRQISRRGWTVISAAALPGQWSFTVGLTAGGAPELAVKDVPEKLALAVLSDAARKVHNGDIEVSPGTRIVHHAEKLWSVAQHFTDDPAPASYAVSRYGAEAVTVLVLEVHQRG